MCANREGFGETARMRSRAQAFAVRSSYNQHFHVDRFNWWEASFIKHNLDTCLMYSDIRDPTRSKPDNTVRSKQQRSRSASNISESDRGLSRLQKEVTHWTHTKETYQTERPPRLIWVLDGLDTIPSVQPRVVTPILMFAGLRRWLSHKQSIGL